MAETGDQIHQRLNIPRIKVGWAVMGDKYHRVFRCELCGVTFRPEYERLQSLLDDGLDLETAKKSLTEASERIMNRHERDHEAERIRQLRRDVKATIAKIIDDEKRALDKS